VYGGHVGKIVTSLGQQRGRGVSRLPITCYHKSDRALGFLLEKCLNFLAELTHVAEIAINGGEPHVGNLVDLSQLLQDEFANPFGGDLLLHEVLQSPFDLLGNSLQRSQGDSSPLASPEQTFDDLLRIELLACPVALDHLDGDLLDVLERRETPTARTAFATTPDRRTLLRGSRVDNPTVRMAAMRTTHGPICPDRLGESQIWRAIIFS